MNGLATFRGVGDYHAAEAHLLATRADEKPNGHRGVMIAPSLGSTSAFALDPTLVANTVAGLATEGWPVLAVDAGGTTTWGNDTCQSRMTDAKTYLTGTVGAKSDKVLLYGFSMGGLTALNWARANPTLVAAVALTCPCVDLAYEHDNNVQGYGPGIEAAYTNLAGFQAAVTTHDPMQNTASYVGVPMKIWYATDDVITITARQQAFISATGCQSVSMGAVGHNATTTPYADVVSFFSQYA